MNNEYNRIIREILQEQTNIVGNKIVQNRVEATKVIKIKNDEIEILTTPEDAIKKLIASFAEIFGDASTEVCQEVIKKHKLISTKSKNIS